MGWFLTYDEPFILIAEESKLEELTRRLMRIGLDKIYGYVPGVHLWTALGHHLDKVNVISQDELKTVLASNHTQIVDVRGAAEFKAGHLAGAEHVFIGTLEQHLNKIRKDQPVVIHCQAGDRSSIGYSILIKHGFSNIRTYPGGISEWVNAGNPVVSE